MKKTSLLIAAVIILGAAGGLAFWQYGKQAAIPNAKNPGMAYDAPTTTPTTGDSAPATSTARSMGKVTWSFAEVAVEDPMSGPKTAVTLTTESNGKQYKVGTYTGSCSVIEASAWKLLADQGEKSGVICWWAGGGTEIGIFEENGQWVVKTGDIEEGSEETPGFRGNFKLLLPLN